MEYYNYTIKPNYFRVKKDFLSMFSQKKLEKENHSLRRMIENIIMCFGIAYITKSTLSIISYAYSNIKKIYAPNNDEASFKSEINVVVNFLLLKNEENFILEHFLNEFLYEINKFSELNKKNQVKKKVKIYIITDKNVEIENFKELELKSISIEEINILDKSHKDTNQYNELNSKFNSIESVKISFIPIEKEDDLINLKFLKNIEFCINYTNVNLLRKNSMLKFSAFINFMINKFLTYKFSNQLFYLNETCYFDNSEEEVNNSKFISDVSSKNNVLILNDSKRISKNYFNKIKVEEMNVNFSGINKTILEILTKNIPKY